MKNIYLLLLFILTAINSFSQTPNWLWAESSGGGNYEYGSGISADTKGNIFVTGRMAATITFGGITATTTGAATVFKGRLNPAGAFSWISLSNYSVSFDYPYGFTRDNHDNTYTTGTYSSGAGFFLDDFNSSGVKKWSVTIPGGATGYALATDNDGNVYVTGDYSSSISFGGTTLASAGGADIFIAKLDSNGNFKWAVSAGGSMNDRGRGITIDPAGYLYVCGGYEDSAKFGSITPPVAATNTSNFFIAKYDTAGNPLWVSTATNAGSTNYYDNAAITCDSFSNLYVTAYFLNTAQFGNQSITSVGGQDIFVAKCLNNGQWEWVKSAGGTGSDVATGIALDKNFDINITGSFANTAQFGSQSITSAGNQNAFVAKYANSTGDLQWVQQAGGASGTSSAAITTDNNGFVYITGSYEGTAAFGASNLTASSTSNIFVAQLDSVPNRQIIVDADSVYCPGSTVLLSFDVIGIFNAGNVFTAQLSDSSGSFINAVNIGDVTGTISGTITISIPANTVPGNHYIIRIVSSNPAYSSYDYGRRIKIGSSVVLTVSNDTTICIGSTVQLHALGAASCSWSPSAVLSCITCDTTLASPTVTTTFTVTGINGVCTATDTVVVQVGNTTFGGIITTLNDTICQGEKGSLTLVYFSGSPLQWQSSIPPGNFNSINGANDTTYQTIPLLQSTWYRVIVGSGACTGVSDSLQIYVPPTPVAAFTNTSTGQYVSFNSSQTTNGAYYSWNFGDGVTDSRVNPTHIYTNSGIYHVCLVVTNYGGCGDTVCHDITVSPTVSCLANFTLYPDTTTPHHWFALNQSVGKSPINYLWQWGDGNSSVGDTASHTYASAGLYTICLTITDDTTCTSTYCDSSVFLYRLEEDYSMVTVNVVSSLPTLIASATSDKNNLIVYPNPCSTCEIKGIVNANDVIITDIVGKTVIATLTKTSAGYSINIPDNRTGIFILKDIRTGEVVKFVKE